MWVRVHGMAAEDSIIQQQVWVVELRLGSGCRAKVRVRVWRPAEDSIIQQQVGCRVKVRLGCRVKVRVRVWRCPNPNLRPRTASYSSRSV